MTPNSRRSMTRVGGLVVVALVAAGAEAAHAQTRPALVRDADNPALQPERLLISVSLSTSEGFKAVDSITVPAGKRLVIENASIWAFTNHATSKITGVWLRVKGQLVYHLLDPALNEVRPLGDGSTVAAYNRPMKGYFNPGETVSVEIVAEGTSGTKHVNVYLQGHYVNLP